MKMLIEIYRNGEKVNEIKTTSKTAIYKKIAEIYKAKEEKRTTRTTIQTSWGTIHKATETYNQDKTQIARTNYKYIYTFEDVEL